jgi:hypothetical protein
MTTCSGTTVIPCSDAVAAEIEAVESVTRATDMPEG